MSIGPGIFVPVVGPSGAGKDSLLSFARRQLADHAGIVFARRVVTRPADPAAEAHDTLGEAAFLCAEAGGAFALSWRSHGLLYGIPASVDDAIHAGGVVVANLSRASVEAAARRYECVLPVLVRVSAEVLAARLAARGRETEREIAQRIARNAAYADFSAHCHTVDNSGALEEAGATLVRLLREAAAGRAPAGFGHPGNTGAGKPSE